MGRSRDRGAEAMTRASASASSTLVLPRRDAVERNTKKLPLPGWVSLPNSAVASCLAVTVTNPMDRAKTLMQLPGASAAWGKNMREVLVNMARKEGRAARAVQRFTRRRVARVFEECVSNRIIYAGVKVYTR